jgi:sulfatase modifying factor 1
VSVQAFLLDEHPTSRREYAAFVARHPPWSRSAVRPLFADGDYLRDWSRDTGSGVDGRGDEAVTSVSWFAARAFCKAAGKRLPTVDEWEYAAAASETTADATRTDIFRQRLLNLYARLGSRGTSNESPRGFRDAHGV